MSSLRLAVEDRKADAVAHLAAARSQNTGPAFWGNLLKIKTAVSVQLSFSLPDFHIWKDNRLYLIYKKKIQGTAADNTPAELLCLNKLLLYGMI